MLANVKFVNFDPATLVADMQAQTRGYSTAEAESNYSKLANSNRYVRKANARHIRRAVKAVARDRAEFEAMLRAEFARQDEFEAMAKDFGVDVS